MSVAVIVFIIQLKDEIVKRLTNCDQCDQDMRFLDRDSKCVILSRTNGRNKK